MQKCVKIVAAAVAGLFQLESCPMVWALYQTQDTQQEALEKKKEALDSLNSLPFFGGKEESKPGAKVIKRCMEENIGVKASDIPLVHFANGQKVQCCLNGKCKNEQHNCYDQHDHECEYVNTAGALFCSNKLGQCQDPR